MLSWAEIIERFRVAQSYGAFKGWGIYYWDDVIECWAPATEINIKEYKEDVKNGLLK